MNHQINILNFIDEFFRWQKKPKLAGMWLWPMLKQTFFFMSANILKDESDITTEWSIEKTLSLLTDLSVLAIDKWEQEPNTKE